MLACENWVVNTIITMLDTVVSFGQVVWLSINLPPAWEPAEQATQVWFPIASPVKGLSTSKTTKPHHTPHCTTGWLAERVMASSPN